MVAGEGITLTEEMIPGVAFGGLFDWAEVPLAGAFPLGGNRVVEPLESAVRGVSPLVAPPHPQPQNVRVIRKMTSRRNGDLPG